MDAVHAHCRTIIDTIDEFIQSKDSRESPPSDPCCIPPSFIDHSSNTSFHSIPFIPTRTLPCNSKETSRLHFRHYSSSRHFRQRSHHLATPSKKTAIIIAYILRKWRYKFSDMFADPWTGFGRWALKGGKQRKGNKLAAVVYQWVNKVMTRKADDEYFLKTVPMIAEHAEFIYPSNLNVRLIKDQLAEYLGNSAKHRSKLFLWALILPADVYLAKFAVIAANAFLCYNVFRVNAHWRANSNANSLQRLLDAKSVTWTSSSAFQSLIERKAGEVSKSIEENGENGCIDQKFRGICMMPWWRNWKLK
ncbi:hypothetical protein BC829DRAFT_491436 [Chytridium lagenaria]|nr:hypothetical protein BC829DRAFT_491436 [Chytridium lagenaria]